MSDPAAKPRRRLPRPSPCEWLFLLVGLGLVFRYRWILDDSCIYYRYVDNLLFLGRGLVYNQGEFVEGYSSPLWLLALVALRALRLDYWSITVAVGLGAYAAFWYAAVVVHRTLQGPNAQPSINLPLVLLSTSYGVTSYFTSGSEGPFVQLAAAAVALYALEPRSRSWQLLLGALPLVRNELVIPLLVAGILGWRSTRRVPWALVTSSLVLGLSWLLFRVWYYADFFPTPFYLKDKVSIGQGLYYLRNGFEPYPIVAFGVALLLAGMTLWRKGESLNVRSRTMMWLIAASSLLYVVKVGGDMMHFRLLAFPFCLTALSMGGVLERWLAAMDLARTARARLVIGGAVGLACFAIYPRFLSSHPVWLHEEREIDRGISDAPWHRHHSMLTFDADRASEDRIRLAAYRAAPGSHTGVRTDVLCAAMFSDFRTRYVHGYGLTEPVLARVDVPEQRPGHKEGLVALARELVTLRSRHPETRPGLVEQAVAEGTAPPWMVANRGKILRIEARMYNSHRLFENVAAALSRIGPLSI